jgi:trans-aconitate methyltransferase
MNELAEFYNEIYLKNPHKWSNIERDFVAFRMLNARIKNPGSFMDIGCGNGHTIAFFHSQWYDTKYTGVDISDVALEIARKRTPSAVFCPRIPPGQTWDVITIMGVVEHLNNPGHELASIRKLLAPSGLIYLEAPNCLAYSSNEAEGFRQTDNGADQKEWHLKRETWENIIKDAGYDILGGYSGPISAWEFIWILRTKAQ